ncbi:inner-membrane translocator [Streptomyces niveiscabiei]|uniref:inner-membrane translocator n=1 Tax=Streptomyces niveiscabiei TaxID=164115 RepID=UPI0029A417D5|nr:inner-membrane translocator [Streptomyces niveiscabiei]MDX3381795.1 inner-membrane translocator [Streptomyces niveiscabiei]
MSEHADQQPSGGEAALTAGCLLFLVLIADAAAGLLVVILLAVRGPGRTDTGTPPPDWGPVLGFGAPAAVLLRAGHRGMGTVQLALCVLLTVHTLGSWP